MATSGWAVDGDVPHYADQARRLTYASTGSAEGVGGVGDLRVLPLTVPGQGVRVTRGSCLIRSKYNSSETETYQGSVTTEELVETTPTGSGSGRSDLIVMRVEDPWANGSTWPEPEDPETAEIFPIRVISGVPAGTKRLQDVPGYQNHTAYTLARIDFPASTGTVTAGMVKDLRELANPRRKDVIFARPRVAADAGRQAELHARMSSNGGTRRGEQFPGGAGFENDTYIDFPEWATRMVVEAHWISLRYNGGRNPYGRCWVEFGDQTISGGWDDNRDMEFTTQDFNFNAPNGSDNSSDNWHVFDELYINPKLRGKSIRFLFKAGLDNAAASNTPGSVVMGALGGLALRVTFSEVADDAHQI